MSGEQKRRLPHIGDSLLSTREPKQINYLESSHASHQVCLLRQLHCGNHLPWSYCLAGNRFARCSRRTRLLGLSDKRLFVDSHLYSPFYVCLTHWFIRCRT